MPWIDRCVKTVLQAIYPDCCPLCRTLTDGGLCGPCAATVPRLKVQCPVCAASLVGTDAECGRCQRLPPAFDHAVAPFYYGPPLAGLLHGFKYGGRIGLARPLALTLAREIATAMQHRPDVIVPVPLHLSRLMRRGFNQSLELARHISAALDIPCSHRIIRRTRRTPPQVGLPLAQRLPNVGRSFALRQPIPGRSVAIVDDVVTSGATANALAAVLKRGGAVHVQVWALLRTDF